MSNMNLREQWQQRSVLIEYLADQLIRGRLGLFLGAGISGFYGLPNWNELVARLCDKNSEPKPALGDDLIAKASFLRAKYYNDDVERFLGDLHQALYQGLTLDFSKLRQNDTLAAIGSLVMSSRRGAAAKVFTLNYDDLLENYLEFHGFTTGVIWEDAHWAQDEDVTIYHPHGFLPLAQRKKSPDIVLGSREYFEIMSSEYWKPLLETSLRTHTFLYLGISGTDMHLQSLLNTIRKLHVTNSERILYHGVRFATDESKDETGVTLEREGVFTHYMDNYHELPKFLFEICQVARVKRMSFR